VTTDSHTVLPAA